MSEMFLLIIFGMSLSFAVIMTIKHIYKLDAQEAQEAEKKRAEKEEAEGAKKIVKKLANLEEYKKALTFTTYELAEIVIGVVAVNNFDKLKEIASVLGDQMHIDEVIFEASKKLSSDMKVPSRKSQTLATNIDYSEKEVVSKIESLIDSCTVIGTGSIGKKIGLSASSISNSSNKGEIRKTNETG